MGVNPVAFLFVYEKSDPDATRQRALYRILKFPLSGGLSLIYKIFFYISTNLCIVPNLHILDDCHYADLIGLK
jgi:hypothetical protein